RDFAQERLEEQGLAHDVRSRQAAYYVQLSERSQLEMLEAGGYSRWIAVLRGELYNLEAVVYWGIEHEPEAALRILAACGSRVFHLAPARVAAWLDAGLAVTSSVDPSVAAAVLRTAGFTHLVVR